MESDAAACLGYRQSAAKANCIDCSGDQPDSMSGARLIDEIVMKKGVLKKSDGRIHFLRLCDFFSALFSFLR